MNKRQLNRWVGVVFFASLLLILWQLLFSPTLDESVEIRSQVPNMPSFDKYTVEKPKKSVEILLSESNQEIIRERVVDEQLTDKQHTDEQHTDEQRILDSHNLPRQYSLKLASFTDLGKANALRKQLQSLGYQTYTRSVVVDKKNYIRVYVGPKLSKKPLLATKDKLDKTFNINAVLVTYDSD